MYTTEAEIIQLAQYMYKRSVLHNVYIYIHYIVQTKINVFHRNSRGRKIRKHPNKSRKGPSGFSCRPLSDNSVRGQAEQSELAMART